jgi:quercetin dioxygenase-like cupin family protein
MSKGPKRGTSVTRPLLECDHSNVRITRLPPGQALPPHRHDVSDLMLYAAVGEGQPALPEGPATFNAGSVAFYRGDEELRVRNSGARELTLLALSAPKFAASA